MSKDTAMLPTRTQTMILEAVAAHFEHWREEKQRGERIPEQLRSGAIALVEDYGLSQVTRRLRLRGRDLNKRRGMPGSGRPRARRVAPPSTFVELASEVVLCKRSPGSPRRVAWS